MPSYQVTFVIPFHNESENAPSMMDRVIQFGNSQKWNFEVVPVNDRSTDGTGAILDKYAKKFKFVNPIHRQNGGELGNTMGLALQAGTKKAKGKIIIWTMGDMSDDTQTYKKIVDQINAGFDMVFGSRYMPGGSRGNLDAVKAFLSSNGTLLARLLFKVPVHDITNAFRGFKKTVFTKVKPVGMGFDISPEFAIKAHKQGFKLGEVPTVYTNREKGVAKFKLLKMTRAYLEVYWRLLTK
jgi:dolichol-phosphate mannosyltransferase